MNVKQRFLELVPALMRQHFLHECNPSGHWTPGVVLTEALLVMLEDQEQAMRKMAVTIDELRERLAMLETRQADDDEGAVV